MNAPQTAEVLATILDRWPGTVLTDEATREYLEELSRFDHAAASAAVASLSREGRERFPPVGVVVRRILEMALDAPTWGEVKASLIEREAALERRREEGDTWVCPEGECDGSGHVAASDDGRTVRRCRCFPAKVESRRAMDVLHPLVREFVGRFVSTVEVTRMMTTGDTTTEAQVREKWRGFIADRVRAASLIGIDAPNVRQVARAQSDLSSAGSAVGKLVAGLGDTRMLPEGEEAA